MKANTSAKPIGLLYDSVSNNTGDQAIGIAIKEYLDQHNIWSVAVDPYSFKPNDYAFLLIGGGFILRDPGDPFYDKFRVPGGHVLNAVGTSTSADLKYLDSYRAVTVRSQADKKRIAAGLSDKEILVIPDPTLLMKPATLEGVDIPAGSVGIHVVADTLKACDGLQDILDAIPDHKVLIPFTHYNYDRRIMIKMNIQGDYQFLEELKPKELFTVIGKMKYVIVSSLHATLFAYAQNIPFLSFYQEKAYDYLSDRGLEHLIFRNTDELKEKLKYINKTPPDFSSQIAKDRLLLESYFKQVTDSHSFPIPGELQQLQDFGYKKPSTRAYKKETLILDLHKDVLSHRDDLIHELIVRNGNLTKQNSSLKSNLISLQNEKQSLHNKLIVANTRLLNKASTYLNKKYNENKEDRLNIENRSDFIDD